MVSGGKVITEKEIAIAHDILKKYKDGKANLEARIISDEEYYKLQYQRDRDKDKKKPSTAWLLNSILNKHADLMDNYPEAICLPRERQDEEDAKVLSSIMPVILEYNDYENTFSKASWYFIKHGVCAQGVFWDNTKENGLGDISIKNVDILNLFWEPGVCDIQDSQNLFYVSLIDNNVLKGAYPELADNSGGNDFTIAEYNHDDNIDNSEKSVVVDWYYKKHMPDGRTVLHYVKYVGSTILFASENEQGYENGFYEHGEYPFTLAVMYPETGTPTGFGNIAVCRDPQEYIDTLDGLMLDYVDKIARPRFWCKKSAGVNKEEFNDWSKSIVEVEGDIDEEKLRQITVQPLGTAVQNLRQMKVDELKETSSNRDFSQGGTAGGITSGAAIATLQEAGNKTSRDMIKAMYRSYVDVVRLTIELIRQFYDEKREFRITGESGDMEFTSYSNENIKEQQIGDELNQMFRKPIFDIDVKAQKQNSYSKLSQNETAVNLFNMGIFNPQMAQQALGMLSMMDFDGIEKIKQYVREGQTYQNVIEQQQQQIMKLSAIVSQLTGRQIVGGEQTQGQAAPQQTLKKSVNPEGVAQENDAEQHLNSYGKKLVERARV